jgi:inorganic pyrophosphatase
MIGDFVYEKFHDIHECPESLIERLRHYFLTYKVFPGKDDHKIQITHVYGRKEAHEIITLSRRDYRLKF